MTDLFSRKYQVIPLLRGWAVTMTANGNIVAKCETEEAAERAREEFERGERFVHEKTDVWVIDEGFVMEAGWGGKMLGEVHQLDMNQFNIVERYTQEEFDALVEKYYEQNGRYPDT